MKQKLNASSLVLSLAFIAIVIGFSAFRQKDFTRQKTFRESYTDGSDDTTARRKRNRPENEFNLDQLDVHMKLLDQQMVLLDKQMEELDLLKIQEQLNSELAKVDAEKIRSNIETALAKVNLLMLSEDINNSTKQEIRVQMEDVKRELEKVKTDLQK